MAQWFSGICDDLLSKIVIWNSIYWAGETHSTRKYMDENTGRVVDKTTRCAHRVPFRLVELNHLVRIAAESKPGSELLKELESIRDIWKHGQVIHGNRFGYGYWSKVKLPDGMHRVITLAFYPEHAKEILDMLMEAKSGQKAANVDFAIQKKESEGKSVFEM